MNPFKTLDQARTDYRAYVESFQRFKNPLIKQFVQERGDLARDAAEDSAGGTPALLWQSPSHPSSARDNAVIGQDRRGNGQKPTPQCPITPSPRSTTHHPRVYKSSRIWYNVNR
jgi:hypothetical protein